VSADKGRGRQSGTARLAFVDPWITRNPGGHAANELGDGTGVQQTNEEKESRASKVKRGSLDVCRRWENRKDG
jgi:hypothetical protein